MASKTPHPEVVFTEGELLVIYVILGLVRKHYGKPWSVTEAAQLSIINKIRRLIGNSPVFQRYLSKGGI